MNLNSGPSLLGRKYFAVQPNKPFQAETPSHSSIVALIKDVKAFNTILCYSKKADAFPSLGKRTVTILFHLQRFLAHCSPLCFSALERPYQPLELLLFLRETHIATGFGDRLC